MKPPEHARDLFEAQLSGREKRLLSGIATPTAVQGFLDSLAYGSVTVYRAPLRVVRERTCQCFDGAVLAAALLNRVGHPALILNLLPNSRDDDHVLAVYRQDGCWGSLAKSNFSGLRSREPVYRDLRELVMSYFEHYYNLHREKTLRGYTAPLDLSRFDRKEWMTQDGTMDLIAGRLDTMRRFGILSRRMVLRLSPVDERLFQAGLQGANRAGLSRPPRRRG